ncbi:PPE family protein [Mycobacterium persicum]|nr:PPE family protein [Mycobacterium persicum]ORB42155.1 hypothetical protein BST40_21060 [Mycobacterium persicum]ORB87989.1 hypothetical protein B1T49_00285 [Mycobacterium persicum]ORC00023.1 hypothetical protein B1T48_00135 [Mycobacterium persicum]
MDFGALPPEINSGRMYAGPGSGSMMAAAAAWDDLAAELAAAASGFESVIAELTSSPWVGPASLSMVAAARPYIAWLSAAAALAEQAGMQARAAAAAYETAFVMTVPPPVIAANRVLLTTLIATNFFGQNTPAIAATEAQYAEMWAQDAAAMYGYAGASATASELTPFADPGTTTDPAGLAAQSAAVAKAAATPAGTSAPALSSADPGLVSTAAVPQLLQQLSTSALAGSVNPNDWWIVQTLGSINNAQRVSVVRTLGLSYFAMGIPQFIASIGQQLTFGSGTTAGSGGAWYATPQFAGLGTGAGRAAASASLASANKVGSLSVPPTWVGSSAEAEHAAAGLVSANVSTNSQGGVQGLLRGIPLGSGAARRGGGIGHRYGFRYSVLTRPPSAG